MLKYAFFMNMPGVDSEDYCAVYENEESYSMMVGTGSMEIAGTLIQRLAEEEFDMVDLCGDFDDDIRRKFDDLAGGKIKVCNASYLPKELEKLEALPTLSEYGIVVYMAGVKDTEYLELRNSQCNTKIAFVKDFDAACEAAKSLVEKGVYFIELCSWFDREKTEGIINAISQSVPVGSCGNLNN